ncbi:hypothetical protein DMUE_5083 [Dictyocoela muelleri]|nr:hypothetical protein DMUE_5083 [Dictyocoela muelleri]
MHLLIVILAKSKSLKTYDLIFEKISSNIKHKPKNIIIDFESAAFVSFKRNFPDSNISGCFFYMSQIVWRHIQKESLTVRYKESGKFRACIKMLLAFSFIPKSVIPDMIILFEFFIAQFDFIDEINLIWNFFKSNYLRLDAEKKVFSHTNFRPLQSEHPITFISLKTV